MKNTLKILSILAWLTTTCFSSDLKKAEYFFNEDPGYGNGTEIIIDSSPADYSLEEVLPIDELPIGFNHFYIRACDTSGKWGHTLERMFYIHNKSITNHIEQVEYFINNDPGYGNGMQLPFTETDNKVLIETSIPLENEPLGFNLFFLRAKSSSGAWGMLSKRFFFNDSPNSPGIKSFEYYFTNSSNFLSQLYEITAQQEQLNLFAFNADVSELKIDSTYTLHVWAIDSLNQRSFEAKVDFTYTENSTGLDFNEVNKLFVHPNPAEDYIYFKLDANLLKNTSIIRIINVAGSVVKQVKVFDDSFNKINIQSLPAGTYMLQFIGQETYTASFIIQ